MNRYPLWKYLLIAASVVIGLLYTLPNFYGEVPAVQVSPLRSNLKADAALMARIEEALKKSRSRPRMRCRPPSAKTMWWH
jgi:preprotein translocase subunit SecD